jgi:hypothetical protein
MEIGSKIKDIYRFVVKNKQQGLKDKLSNLKRCSNKKINNSML